MDINRPVNQEIKVSFYKPGGKWYTDAKAVVNHYMFEDGYKQDIVDTQDTMSDGWQEGEYFVVTTADENIAGFHEALYTPHSFKGIKKRG